jgi:hypothetical protein
MQRERQQSMCRKNIVYRDADWIYLVQKKIHRRDVVNTAMNIQFPKR